MADSSYVADAGCGSAGLTSGDKGTCTEAGTVRHNKGGEGEQVTVRRREEQTCGGNGGEAGKTTQATATKRGDWQR